VNAFASGFDAVLEVLRVVFFVAAIALAIVCAIDWAARTRRINPFNPIARFFRQTVDPLMAPIERSIVRRGGLPSNAPWWTLAGVVILGIVVISVLGFVRTQLLVVAAAAGAGPRGIGRVVVSWIFALLQIALLVRVLISWIPRVSPYSKWVRWAFVLTEPILRPLRRIVPTIGMIDITPIIAYFVLRLAAGLVLSLF
jgi:YggT family protein